jgi:peptidoglycan LD-endopeptidase LytH
MRAQTRGAWPRSCTATAAALVAVLALGLLGIGQADAADPRLQQAEQARQEAQARLVEVLDRLHAVEAELAGAEASLAQLAAQEEVHQESASVANNALAYRVRAAYKRGQVDPSLAMLSLTSPAQATEHARLLGMLATRSRADIESASAARIRTRASAAEVAHITEELRERRGAVEGVRAEAAALLAQAEQQEQQVRATIAAEQAAREREARERAERERAAKAARQRASAPRPTRMAAGASAPVAGNVACPIGPPRSYSDTYGAPRSGGRSHRGTDIVAPRGTPVFAYENGAITRMSTSRLGGISLYLRGDSGHLYYYAHLQGYVAGLSAGQRVGVGQHIAFNGDTGNARGIPHLHFEVMPGGGGNVNPYPYVRRACG